MPAQNLDSLATTETALAQTDRHWRAEMVRFYGPDSVLRHGFGKKASGPVGTLLRQTYEARQTAITAWKRERKTGTA